MKVAPLYLALKQATWARSTLVHTGQHYDNEMSGSFIKAFGLPDPDYNLGVGSGTHAQQTAGVLLAYDNLLSAAPPDLCIVVGDVNSTLACALACAKRGVPTAHLEAGLRSRDRTMPEEINRLLTDAIADVHWAPSQDGVDNLLAEGVPAEKIELVGNIMIDALVMKLPEIRSAQKPRAFRLEPQKFLVSTIHRPSNVDDPEKLRAIIDALSEISKDYPVLFPVHPRTKRTIELLKTQGLEFPPERLIFTEPLSYFDFMSCVTESRAVITDSGGVQEETSFLGIPCFTLRDSTERPITITLGTNRLVQPDSLQRALEEALRKPPCPPPTIPLWDGMTAQRIVTSIERRFL